MNKKQKAVNKKHRRNKLRLKNNNKSSLLSSSKNAKKTSLEKDNIKPA